MFTKLNATLQLYKELSDRQPGKRFSERGLSKFPLCSPSIPTSIFQHHEAKLGSNKALSAYVELNRGSLAKVAGSKLLAQSAKSSKTIASFCCIKIATKQLGCFTITA